LLLAVIAALAVALVATIGAFNLLLAHQLSQDASRLARDRAAGAIALLRPVGNRLVVGEAPDVAVPDRQVWVFSGGRTLEAPAHGQLVSAAARALAARAPASENVAETRLYATPVVVRGRRLGTVVAAVSLAPYEQTRNTALVSSLVLGLVLLLVAGLGARWLLASALRPVARMTRQAAVWSERELDHRFELGEPHDELTELAATLDELLDRLAASLRRERRFSAELSHELRTPLAGIIAETDLALRRERAPGDYRDALHRVHGNARKLEQTVDALVAAARHEAGGRRGTADAYAVVREAAASCSPLAEERGLRLEVIEPPHPIRLGVEADLAERILQPVVENACRYGHAAVRLSVARTDRAVTYSVEDDGPGVDEDERERIFEAGVRGRAGANGQTGGAGLGLALARRLAHSASGDVTAGEGGFRVVLPAG
jgi:signal transduction histidine kinase